MFFSGQYIFILGGGSSRSNSENKITFNNNTTTVIEKPLELLELKAGVVENINNDGLFRNFNLGIINHFEDFTLKGNYSMWIVVNLFKFFVYILNIFIFLFTVIK